MKTTTDNTYNIQLASRISGVGVHTIRAWEKRYGAVVPMRNSSGRREYTDSDIERLTLLSELCTIGHTIGKIANKSTQDLKEMIQHFGGNPAAEIQKEFVLGKGNPLVDIPETLKSLLMALKMFKLDIINHELSKIKLLLDSRQMALEIIGPLLKEVGDAVERGSLDIAQEHALSALLKFHIGHLLFRNAGSRSKKPYRFLISTMEGDYHEFGILQSALLCNHYSLDYVYMGPNLPANSLVESAKSLEVTHLLLGSTVIPEGKDVKFVNRFIQSVSRRLEGQKVLIGGGPHIDWEKYKSRPKTDYFSSMTELDDYLKTL